MRRTLLTLVGLLLTGLRGAPAGAQADADARELAAYRLTMAAVRQVDAVTDAIYAEMRKDPKFQEYARLNAQVEALEAKEERTEAEDERLEQLRERLDALESEQAGEEDDTIETLSDMEAMLTRTPAMARGLRAAGMAPREYAKFMLTMLGASLAAGLKKEGMLAALPQGVSAENVKFVEEHEAELTAVQKKWDAMSKGVK